MNTIVAHLNMRACTHATHRLWPFLRFKNTQNILPDELIGMTPHTNLEGCGHDINILRVSRYMPERIILKAPPGCQLWPTCITSTRAYPQAETTHLIMDRREEDFHFNCIPGHAKQSLHRYPARTWRERWCPCC